MKKFFVCAAFMLFGILNVIQAQLPSVTLKDINGKTVNTAELSNDGKPFIIDFFATLKYSLLKVRFDKLEPHYHSYRQLVESS